MQFRGVGGGGSIYGLLKLGEFVVESRVGSCGCGPDVAHLLLLLLVPLLVRSLVSPHTLGLVAVLTLSSPAPPATPQAW